MDTVVNLMLTAIGLAAGGYLAFKPEKVYAAALSRRRPAARDSATHHREVDLRTISASGFFIILITAYGVYLWVSGP